MWHPIRNEWVVGRCGQLMGSPRLACHIFHILSYTFSTSEGPRRVFNPGDALCFGRRVGNQERKTCATTCRFRWNLCCVQSKWCECELPCAGSDPFPSQQTARPNSTSINVGSAKHTKMINNSKCHPHIILDVDALYAENYLLRASPPPISGHLWICLRRMGRKGSAISRCAYMDVRRLYCALFISYRFSETSTCHSHILNIWLIQKECPLEFGVQ